MAKKTKKRKAFKGLSKRARMIVLPLMVVVGAGALILAIITIIVMPRVNPGSQHGVGANGFRAFEEPNGNLGMGAIVGKTDVTKALGNKAKSVDDVQVSTVMNLDGNRGQTATFYFVRADGTKVSLYADLMFFKNQASLDSAHITAGTLPAGTIDGKPAFYMHALTIGKDREYRLLVVDGLKAYKFVISQPRRNVTISEVSALAVLKKVAEAAKF